MAKTIADALQMMQRIGVNNVLNMSLDNNQTTYHVINHRFRENVILPFVGIEKNVDWIMSKGNKVVRCADGIEARVVEWHDSHICALEKDIQEIYNMDCWSFLKRWYNTEKRMDSMTFIKMKLEKL